MQGIEGYCFTTLVRIASEIVYSVSGHKLTYVRRICVLRMVETDIAQPVPFLLMSTAILGEEN
jgi:hypothetical protein